MIVMNFYKVMALMFIRFFYDYGYGNNNANNEKLVVVKILRML